MSGSATFTTVMSSSNMKIAVQTAINVHHLRSSPSTARGYFAGDPHRNGGIDAHPAEYERRVVRFFDQALLDKGGAK